MSRIALLSSAALAVIAVGLSPARAADAATNAVDARPVITVTATRLPQLTSEVPVTVTVIDEERIADLLATDIRDILRFEPGVTVRRAPARFGGVLGSTGRDGNADINIRGIGGNRVLIQVDGIRAPNGFTFGAQAAGRGDYVDIGLVKSLEVLRGPGSALYGSDGLAGVVSFQTSDPEDLLGEGRSVTGSLRATYDSASEEFSETASLAGRAGGWSAMIAYSRRDGEELDNAGDVGGTGETRTLPNPQDTRSDALLGKIVFAPHPDHRIRLTGEWLDSRVSGDILSARVTSPFTGATTDRLLSRDTIERMRVSLDWRYEGEGAIDAASVALYWQDADNRQFADEDRSGPTNPPDRFRRNSFDNRVYGAHAEARAGFATGGIEHDIVFGGDISFTNQTGLRDGDVPPIGETFPSAAFPETDFMLGGLFIGNRMTIGPVSLFPAVRFDFYDLDPEDDPLLPTFDSAGQNGSRVTPRIGAVVDMGSGVSLYANYAQGFRAPEPSQVNQFFENFIFGYTSLPNPDLEPETSETWEGGVRYVGDILSASLTGFIGRYDDFISQEVVSGSFRPGDPGVFQFVNLESVEIEGLEGRASFDFPGGFDVDASFAWATGDVVRPDGSESPLSTINPLEIVLGAGWRDPEGRFGGQAIMTFAARKDVEDALGVCTAECFRPRSFTVFDVTAFWRITDNFTLRAGLFNMFDAKYAWWSDVRGLNADAPALDAYTQPGRNVRVSLTARF
ncbi:MAG: TonB-dependent hemoglobin/transferrin/lactoferrin family receptor [Parasphingopyxis sp.]|uniref:TonB-dependent hemoglobin/transferrin/lactoferrin family receptor n=1 Tax=Parasphingopyxis sp. TaxID=1920299 RepID=UPI003FA01355